MLDAQHEFASARRGIDRGIIHDLALIAEFENDIRRERQMDGIAKAKDRGVKFGRKRELTDDRVKEIRDLRESGETVPAIIKRTGFSKASVYRALGTWATRNAFS
jgi:DNA invertase Pin-like site-specific DNA recombinase